MGPTWGPPGSCRPQMGPMLAHEPCYQGSSNCGKTEINSLRDRSSHIEAQCRICVNKLSNIGSMTPGRRQAIISTITGILLVGPNFSWILIEVHISPVIIQENTFKMSVKWRPFCLGLNVIKPLYMRLNWYSTKCQAQGSPFSIVKVLPDHPDTLVSRRFVRICDSSGYPNTYQMK